MIQLIPCGGLGNQLFQIAASYSLALENDEAFSICGNEHFLPCQGLDISSYRSNVLRNFDFADLDPGLQLYRYEESPYKAIPHSKDVCLFGYLQSERYFFNNKDKILEALKPTASIDEYILNNYKITENSISIHVRRGDYLKLDHIHPVQTPEYYQEALKRIGSDGEVLVFSDDLNWCKDNFKGDNFTFVNEDDYLCLYIMSKCPYNIGCNSSFSWWGAYLNPSESGNAIFPSRWLGDRLFSSYSDIYLKEWSLI